MKRVIVCTLLGVLSSLLARGPVPALPPVEQELRGVWVATTHNLDWPSKSGLSSAQQQSELVRLFDTIQSLNLNSVFLQIRSSADTFYPSQIEPWSKWLTGREGQPPSPYWDPLKFAIQEAHRRGLDLHAWVNPYRAGQTQADFFAPQHLLRKRPDLLRAYHSNFWLDPGSPDAQQHILEVISDIVSRYRVDGLHIDDYFYPYPKPGWQFNDQNTYQAHAKGTGLEEWRRHNVDTMVSQIAKRVKRIDPALVFGVSPFAIWQNNTPQGVSGMSSYHMLYADSRKWLAEGWVDYLAPQFYWPVGDTDRPYARLFSWWQQQNLKDRLLLSGINLRAVDDGQAVRFEEVEQKVRLTRVLGGQGEVFYSISALQQAPWRTQLLQLYPQPALPPALPWLNIPPVDLIALRSSYTDNRDLQLSWQNLSDRSAKRWVIYVLEQDKWNYYLIPEEVRRLTIPKQDARRLRRIGLRAVNRANQLGKAQFIDIASL